MRKKRGWRLTRSTLLLGLLVAVNVMAQQPLLPYRYDTPTSTPKIIKPVVAPARDKITYPARSIEVFLKPNVEDGKVKISTVKNHRSRPKVRSFGMVRQKTVNGGIKKQCLSAKCTQAAEMI